MAKSLERQLKQQGHNPNPSLYLAPSYEQTSLTFNSLRELELKSSYL